VGKIFISLLWVSANERYEEDKAIDEKIQINAVEKKGISSFFG